MLTNGTERAPERSNFAKKCNLLSQYLKKKGSFGDINLGLTRLPESSIGLSRNPDPIDLSLSSADKAIDFHRTAQGGQQNARLNAESSEIKPSGFIQKLCGGGPSTSPGDKLKNADFSEPANPETVPDLGASQLTIFFGGKIVVFNEFPADKANEILEIAKQVNPQTVSNVAAGTEPMGEENCKNNNNNNMVLPDLNEPSSSGNANNQLVDRIARRASLHRFFAKRKDRAAARAPYQVNHNVAHLPKPEGANPSLERGQSSGQVEKPLHEEKEEGQCSKDLELRL